MSFFLEQTFRGLFGPSIRSYPDPKWQSIPVHVFGYAVPRVDAVVIVLAIVAMAILYVIIQKTRMGTAMRAVSEDVDTAAMNVAFLDRFGPKIAFDYLPVKAESEMLSHRSRLPLDATTIMINYAKLTRNGADSGTLTIGVTPRRLLAWSKLVKAGIGSAKAFQSCVICGSAPEDRETLISLEQTSLKSDHEKIDAIARGLPVPLPVAPMDAAGATLSETAAKFPND